jgi:hypothetical protein
VQSGDVSLEEAYSLALNGRLTAVEMGLASELMCECGNADGYNCMSSEHTRMREELLDAGKIGVIPARREF